MPQTSGFLFGRLDVHPNVHPRDCKTSRISMALARAMADRSTSAAGFGSLGNAFGSLGK